MVASKLPRVPIRITSAKRLLSGIYWYRGQFACGSDRVDSGLVELRAAEHYAVPVSRSRVGWLKSQFGARADA